MYLRACSGTLQLSASLTPHRKLSRTLYHQEAGVEKLARCRSVKNVELGKQPFSRSVDSQKLELRVIITRLPPPSEFQRTGSLSFPNSPFLTLPIRFGPRTWPANRAKWAGSPVLEDRKREAMRRTLSWQPPETRSYARSWIQEVFEKLGHSRTGPQSLWFIFYL